MFNDLLKRIEMLVRAGAGWVGGRAGRVARRLWFKLQAPFFHYIPYDWLLFVLAPIGALYGVMIFRGVDGAMIRLNVELLLNQPPSFKTYSVWFRRAVLGRCLYFENRRLFADLKLCSKQLEAFVERIRAEGSPVIFAPLHMTQDVLLSCICTWVAPRKTWFVMLPPPTDHIGPDEEDRRKKFGFNYTTINPFKRQDPALRQALRALKRGEGNLVLFPDVLPEVTWRVFKKAMRTEDCVLFGRKGRLHSGIDVIAKAANAKVVFLILKISNGRLVLDILQVVPAERVMLDGPKIIEAALRREPESWLLWHSSSSFFFNSSDRINNE